MSFFKRKAKTKEPEKVTDVKANRAPVSPHSASPGLRNHSVIQDVAGPSPVAINAISANMDSFARGRTAILKKQPSHMEAAHFGDLGHSSVNYQPQETRSRLSKTVDQVLRDNVAMPHYIQFMERRGADHLVRFWQEAESFRSTSWSRVRAHSLNSVKHSSLAEPVPTSPDSSDPSELTQTPANTLTHQNSNDSFSAQWDRRGSSSSETGLRPGTPRSETPSKNMSSKTGTPFKGQTSSTLRDLSDKLMKTKICGEDGLVDPNSFVIAQSVVLTSWSNSTLVTLFYFSEFMEKEEAMNILQFWLAADNFQNQLAAKKGQYDGQEAQNDAMILYDKYFSLQATNPLGFDDSVRMEIESNICREGGPLPDCFTTPLRQAWTTMEKVYMPGFLSSNLYYKYLSDLINSVRADEFVNVNSSGQGGAVESERSSSNASESSQTQQCAKKAAIKILKNFDEAITVDAASLDPETLYQRPYAGKMTFGKVNELGQFIREAEPEPDVKKSKGSMFSQAMKKWVQGNSDEAQEEMAWKIAKMIVNDVVHQSNHDSPVKSTKL
ncbi:hypothetical protein WMY93_011625 [Mugilogobius chulae]|uniref:RGS domain-containing protein n=1 Tax=Mugilogobius chulae TaxID=88201 RepID=A0AAW0PC04_9GOBI